MKSMTPGKVNQIIVTIVTIMVISAGLTACAQPPATPTVEVIPPTATMPPATATPTEPPPAWQFSLERKAEIIRNVNSFLNAEGQYSEEELRNNDHWFDLLPNEKKPLPLGVTEQWPNTAQAIQIDYLYTGNAFHFFLGTYGTNGQRIVIDFCHTPEYLRYSVTPGNLVISPGELTVYHDYENNAEFWGFLEERIGSPMGFSLEFKKHNELSDEDIQLLKDYGRDPEEYLYITDFINKQEQLEYQRDIWFLINKSNFDIRFQMGTDIYQTDNVMSVIYFDAGNLMEADDLTAIENELPIGYSFFQFRQ